MLSDADLEGMRATQEVALPDLCDIARESGGSTSTIGSQISGAHAPIAANVPCRVTPAQMYVTLGERAQPLDIDRYTIRLPLGTDIKKRDQVTIQGSGLMLEVERVRSPRSWETVLTIEADIPS